MEQLLKSKTAIITGATRGLGKAIAFVFAREGATVAILGRKQEAIDQTVSEIQAAGYSAHGYKLDVANQAEIDQVLPQIHSDFGKIDILVNNAGIAKELPLMEMPLKVWYDHIDTNLNSTARMIKAILPIMTSQKSGNIVNIASAAGLRGRPNNSAYSASKAGIINLSQAIGDEVRHYGIRVNAVCPGPIDTEMFQNCADRDFILAAGSDIFTPETIANAVLFCASDMSAGMNSQIITMRGFNRW